MVADLQFVSDSDYFADFERDLDQATAPQVLARLEFSRNGPWTSLNVRELRREQLSSGLEQQTLPEIEWRGRSKRLGTSPVYLSFESSMASIQQKGSTIDADYLRGDVEPVFSMPLSRLPWLDVTPQVSYRYTYWTQSQPVIDGTRTVVDESLTRGLWTYGIEIVGPKFFAIFDRPNGSKLKHSIETQVAYGFAESFDDADDILAYDEVDRASGSGKQVRYALVQRLFAKRPRARPAPPPGGDTLFPEAEEGDSPETPEAPSGKTPPPEPEEDEPDPEPIEIASLEISQRRSFDEDISSADLDLDGSLDVFSSASPISLTGRFNPSPGVSVDVRSSYDILYDRFRDVSLSGNLRNNMASARFSLVHTNGLGVNPSTLERREDSTQLRLTTGIGLMQRRLQLNFDGSYNAQPAEGQSHFPDQRWQLQYQTQCCTFFVERLTRDFTGNDNRRELYFRVDLRGVGKILQSTF
jgi:hypothetical protein